MWILEQALIRMLYFATSGTYWAIQVYCTVSWHLCFMHKMSHKKCVLCTRQGRAGGHAKVKEAEAASCCTSCVGRKG